MTADLVARLRAAIDATEADAREVPGHPSWYESHGLIRHCDDESVAAEAGYVGEPGERVAAHIARHDPASVLRRCAADRRIVDLYETAVTAAEVAAGTPLGGAAKLTLAVRAEVVRLLAEGYGVTEEQT